MSMIDVCVITWPREQLRRQYLDRSLKSLARAVSASRHGMRIFVSAETQGVDLRAAVATQTICQTHGAHLHWRDAPASLGGNMNSALALGDGDYKLLTQDDWGWERNIDISDDAHFLRDNPEFAMVRYAVFYTRFLPNDPPKFWVVGDFMDQRYYDAAEVDMTGSYPYGDQPHIRRADYKTRVSPTGGRPIGDYYVSEPGDFGTPENAMAGHLAGNGWRIMARVPNVVAHIGVLSSDPARRPQ